MPRDAASALWGFAYDPRADTVTMGPYRIDVGLVDQVAGELAYAIYMAAHEVDRRNTARCSGSRSFGHSRPGSQHITRDADRPTALRHGQPAAPGSVNRVRIGLRH